MAAQAVFRHGDPIFEKYTPGADVNAGDIVVLGNLAGLTCGIAHLPIANGTLGSLAMGNGIYQVKVAANYAAWTKVYWDPTNAVLTSTSTNMVPFGYTLELAPAANAVVECKHDPDW